MHEFRKKQSQCNTLRTGAKIKKGEKFKIVYQFSMVLNTLQNVMPINIYIGFEKRASKQAKHKQHQKKKKE